MGDVILGNMSPKLHQKGREYAMGSFMSKRRIHCNIFGTVNPLVGTGNYSATSKNMKLVQPAQAPPHCTKCNSPPINGQCTNHCIAVV